MIAFLRKVLLVFGYALLGASVVGFLSGSTCIYVGGNCDDDDDFFDDDDDYCDDDDGTVTTSTALPTVTLIDAEEEVFRMDPSRMFVDTQGDVRRIETTHGLSIFAFLGLEVASERDFELFGTRVLLANAPYLGWEEVPELGFLGMVGLPTGTLLAFETSSSSVTVELDGSGSLLAIESQPSGQ